MKSVLLILLVVVVLYALIRAIDAWMHAHIPDGYEDAEGFHYGQK